MLRLGVHDSSRLEWIAELPFPADGRADDFELDFLVEIPAHLWIRHDNWERLQVLARLASPVDEDGENVHRLISVDELRRSALAAAQRAKEAEARIEHGVFAASIRLAPAPAGQGGEGLLARLQETLAALRERRDFLCKTRQGETDEVARERALSGEFLSNHALELIGRIERAVVAHLLHPACRAQGREELAAELRGALARALEAEFDWRKAHAIESPRERDPWELERYVARVSVLKKHFQGLLFLQVEAEHSDQRFHALLGAVSAILGALVAFPLALFLTGGHGVAGLGVGLTWTILLVALTYGVREPIKEGAKNWLKKRMTDNIGGRLTTVSTRPTALQEPLRLLSVRESFTDTQADGIDPQHPDLGKTVPMVRLRYRMWGTLQGDPHLSGQGTGSVRLVFRYDLSPLFSRLDDPIKEVPILAENHASIRFTDAARSYRFPVKLSVRCGGDDSVARGVLVSHKLGLDRMDLAEDEVAPLPSGPVAAVFVGSMRRR
ncbi:hypothetical protein [Vulgatibacter incomptus]|uniref:Uncharacterized protein n=1 Tax=Vulgatibacter incomptus TaxID=1391653 RepID=A0A0K1PE72_9BACT|nr:hypothetical protein [Vulgatibacter incomptus]AKU91429.1 hypothetical protein AKJ08_1816 [Vulgatibacter incomptus]